ncbi:hypothetical protein ACWD5V_28560 [Streptomyces sp. NPDC002523]
MPDAVPGRPDAVPAGLMPDAGPAGSLLSCPGQEGAVLAEHAPDLHRTTPPRRR